MIHFSCIRQNGEVAGFLCTGHAGYASAGHDIVCSAVSALTTNCVNSVEALLHVSMDVTVEESMGLMRAELPTRLTQRQQEGAQLLIRSLLCGMESLAEAYPTHVACDAP